MSQFTIHVAISGYSKTLGSKNDLFKQILVSRFAECIIHVGKINVFEKISEPSSFVVL